MGRQLAGPFARPSPQCPRAWRREGKDGGPVGCHLVRPSVWPRQRWRAPGRPAGFLAKVPPRPGLIKAEGELLESEWPCGMRRMVAVQCRCGRLRCQEGKGLHGENQRRSGQLLGKATGNLKVMAKLLSKTNRKAAGLGTRTFDQNTATKNLDGRKKSVRQRNAAKKIDRKAAEEKFDNE